MQIFLKTGPAATSEGFGGEVSTVASRKCMSKRPTLRICSGIVATNDPQCLHLIASGWICSLQYGHFPPCAGLTAANEEPGVLYSVLIVILLDSNSVRDLVRSGFLAPPPAGRCQLLITISPILPRRDCLLLISLPPVGRPRAGRRRSGERVPDDVGRLVTGDEGPRGNGAGAPAVGIRERAHH